MKQRLCCDQDRSTCLFYWGAVAFPAVIWCWNAFACISYLKGTVLWSLNSLIDTCLLVWSIFLWEAGLSIREGKCGRLPAVLAAVCVPACHQGGVSLCSSYRWQSVHSSGSFILESCTNIYYLREVNIYLNGYLLYLYIKRFFMMFKYLLPSLRHFLWKWKSECLEREAFVSRGSSPNSTCWLAQVGSQQEAQGWAHWWEGRASQPGATQPGPGEPGPGEPWGRAELGLSAGGWAVPAGTAATFGVHSAQVSNPALWRQQREWKPALMIWKNIKASGFLKRKQSCFSLLQAAVLSGGQGGASVICLGRGVRSIGFTLCSWDSHLLPNSSWSGGANLEMPWGIYTPPSAFFFFSFGSDKRSLFQRSF